MTEDNKYMDDQFKRASEDLKFPYQSSFWNEVESQLADDSLDSAFKSASEKVLFVPQMDLAENIDNAFHSNRLQQIWRLIIILLTGNNSKLIYH